MWTKSKLDKKITTRWNNLGRLGEELAELNLRKAGFVVVRNLNQDKRNNCFADIYAVKEGQPYVISVKARNKYENNGSLNARYKLGKNCYPHAGLAETQHNAKAAWITIAVDVNAKRYDAYFGLLSDLNENTGVSMTPEITKKYQCLASGADLLRDSGLTEQECLNLKNIYQKK